MTTEPLILASRLVEIPFERAEDLVAALRPENSLWAPDPGLWIFRGHADARWRLLPSVARRRLLRRFVQGVEHLSGDPMYCEPSLGDVLRLLEDFAQGLNRAGLPIPGGAGVLTALQKLFLHGLFSPDFMELAALAQHHGLPTFLLDWTTVATYAAYFAASDFADIEGVDPDGRIEIWALHRHLTWLYGKAGKYLSKVKIVEPLRAGNANLHSQGGVFTYVEPTSDTHHSDEPLTLASVDDLAGAVTEATFPEAKLLRLSLPQKEAQEVLRILAYERVAGTAMFPGLQGVVRAVRDDRHKR